MHVLTVELVYWAIKGNFNYLLKSSSYKGEMCFSNKQHYASLLKKKKKPTELNEDLQMLMPRRKLPATCGLT